MQSRRLIIYILVLLGILVGMLVYLFIHSRDTEKALRESSGENLEKKPDLANGASIYQKGADLQGRMIPLSGGPEWLLTKGGGCAACHGEDGRGGKPVEGLTIVPPNVSKAVNRGIGGMSKEEFANLLKWGELPNGKALSHEMPRFDVPDDEVSDLLDYIRQL
jgi:mono/diheme cytochrome c family protein